MSAEYGRQRIQLFHQSVGKRIALCSLVQRFAKVLAVGLSLILTAVFTEFGTIRWLSLLSSTILIVWIFASRHAGKQFADVTR